MNSPQPAAVSIIGFPKCATSSLWQYFNNQSSLNCLRSSSGSIECDITLGTSQQSAITSASGVLAKYSACIYSMKKLRAWHQMLMNISAPAYIICIGDPKSRCISWYRFHRELAFSGRDPNHFAYVNRDKYMSMNLDSYCDERGDRLNYGHYLRKSLEVLASEEVLILNMETLSSNLHELNRWAERLGVHFDGEPAMPYRNKNKGPDIRSIESFSHQNLNRLEEYNDYLESFRGVLPARWRWL